MVSKSAYKTLLSKKYPESVCPPNSGCDVVIIDGLCDLQGMYPR